MVKIVLPAYNEEEALTALLPDIKYLMEGSGTQYEVIVVDDGSADGTSRVVQKWSEQMPVKLVAHEVNRGLAATIMTGLKTALADLGDRDIVITMDADNTHAPGLIRTMLQKIHEGADVVIASRFRPGARVVGVSTFRKLMSWGASVLFRVILPIRGVHDYTCGYRAYRGWVLHQVFADLEQELAGQSSFACMVDILLLLRRNPKIVIAEVPMILRYDQKPGKSKMPVGKTIRDTLRLLLQHRFQRGR